MRIRSSSSLFTFLRHPPRKCDGFVRLSVDVEDAGGIQALLSRHLSVVRHADVKMAFHAFDEGARGRDRPVGR